MKIINKTRPLSHVALFQYTRSNNLSVLKLEGMIPDPDFQNILDPSQKPNIEPPLNQRSFIQG